MRLEKCGNIYSFVNKGCTWHGYYDTTENGIKYYIINDIAVGFQTGYDIIKFYI